MSIYIKLLTLEYPRHEGDIRLEYPEILETQTGDDFPCPSTYAKVEWVDPPEINPNTQKYFELSPTQVGGIWTIVWGVKDLTDEEKEDLQILRGLGNSISVERL